MRQQLVGIPPLHLEEYPGFPSQFLPPGPTPCQLAQCGLRPQTSGKLITRSYGTAGYVSLQLEDDADKCPRAFELLRSSHSREQ